VNAEQKMVEDFHRKYGCELNEKPTLADLTTLFLRARLIQEEASEFTAAANQQNIVEMADSLCDLLVVVYGTAVALGMDLEPLFAEVHRSNMTKTTNNLDSGGKVQKGKDFVPPNLEPILKSQG